MEPVEIKPIKITDYQVKQSKYEICGKLPIRSILLGPLAAHVMSQPGKRSVDCSMSTLWQHERRISMGVWKILISPPMMCGRVPNSTVTKRPWPSSRMTPRKRIMPTKIEQPPCHRGQDRGRGARQIRLPISFICRGAMRGRQQQLCDPWRGVILRRGVGVHWQLNASSAESGEPVCSAKTDPWLDVTAFSIQDGRNKDLVEDAVQHDQARERFGSHRSFGHLLSL